jgi:hypothetical protein
MSMKEQEWLEATATKPMLEFLRHKVTHRKLGLFFCACCRRIWHLFTDERSRKAIEAAENFADGLLRVKDLTPISVGPNSVTVSAVVGQEIAGFCVFDPPFVIAFCRPRPAALTFRAKHRRRLPACFWPLRLAE